MFAEYEGVFSYMCSKIDIDRERGFSMRKTEFFNI